MTPTPYSTDGIKFLKTLGRPRIDSIGPALFFRDPYTNNDSLVGVGFPVWFGKAADENVTHERLGSFNNWNTALRWVETNRDALGKELALALAEYIKTEVGVITPAAPRETLLKFGGTLTHDEYTKQFVAHTTHAVVANDLAKERLDKINKQKAEREENKDDEVVTPIAFFKSVLEKLDPDTLNCVTIAAFPALGFFAAENTDASDDFAADLHKELKWDWVPRANVEDYAVQAGPYMNRKKAKSLTKKYGTPKEAKAEKKVVAPKVTKSKDVNPVLKTLQKKAKKHRTTPTHHATLEVTPAK